MSRLDRSARAAALLAAVLLLLLVPDLASAKLGSSTPAALQVGTASLVAPTSVAGSFKCSTSGLNEGVVVTVTGLTDTGPPGAQYVYTLLRGTTVRATTTSASKTATLTGSQAVDLGTTVWTLTVQTKLGSWTSAPASRSVTCQLGGTNSGSF